MTLVERAARAVEQHLLEHPVVDHVGEAVAAQEEDVARLERLPALVGMVRPHTGQAVSLQFDSYLDAVCFGAASNLALCFLRLRQDAEQILHVMPDLVRDHIG